MDTHQDALRGALKRAASAMKAAGPDFALAGSYALWVHGAPEPVHDVDFVVAEVDAGAAAETLADAGFAIERTPEDWLFKASTADGHDVLAIAMPVLSATVVMCQKLKSLHEHHCNFAALLPATRAVREQVDWAVVRDATADNDFATAFLFLVERLGIVTISE
ncbi:hypothetical protein ASD37_08935 [Mycobacterium sp. Root135]|uniref:hypothetical protein n=1 Tax=Mycobacterium sp. Root135 TaxID=1736457 RepID=UPI0006F96DC3|nr:hypothetical protein [Mycobacterium sp. Root135]KQY08072.1 hypothetical protein ASD37_08935 [Mycobacterium sp. Root135]